MSEEQRIESINTSAIGHLEDWLSKLETEEVSADDLLAALYGASIAAILLGYSPEHIVEDARKGAEKLERLVEEESQSKLFIMTVDTGAESVYVIYVRQFGNKDLYNV